jgi:hypothetical protein
MVGKGDDEHQPESQAQVPALHDRGRLLPFDFRLCLVIVRLYYSVFVGGAWLGQLKVYSLGTKDIKILLRLLNQRLSKHLPTALRLNPSQRNHRC